MREDAEMIMMYAIFAMSIFLIRILAGYDSRYQSGKYLSVKNPVLSKILLDGMSVYGSAKRPEKDRNKMSIRGIPLYTAAFAVLLINLIFLFVADIPAAPWGIETDKLLVYADTLNDKISAVGILLLFSAVMVCIGFTIIGCTKKTKPTWAKVSVWVAAVIMISTAVLLSLYFLVTAFS